MSTRALPGLILATLLTTTAAHAAEPPRTRPAPTAPRLRTIGVAPLPDLVVEGLQVVPATPVAGAPFSVSGRVRNAGAGSAGAFETSLRVGAEAAPVVVKAPGLAPGASMNLQRQVTGQPAGPCPVTVTADSARVVAESNETNNVGGLPLRIRPATSPDLRLVSVALIPPSPAPGQTFRITALVENSGDAPSPECAATFKVQNETTTPTLKVAALAPLARTEVTRTLQADDAPKLQVTVAIDSGKTVAERSELNNGGTYQFQMGGKPDLVFDRLLVPTSPIYEGARFQVQAIFKNAGAVPSAPCSALLGVQGGGTAPSASAVGAVKPGATVPVGRLLGPLPTGTWQVKAVVDSGNAVAELNETNNTGYATVQVLPAPTN